jgi:hypothetical protein
MDNKNSKLNLTKKKMVDNMYKNIKSNKETNEIKYIEIKKIYPLHGSVQNYYHFMMSVFIPLLLDTFEYLKKGIEPVYIFNTNFGPMLRILMELPINIKFRYSDMELCQKLDKDKLIEQKLFKAYDMHPNPNILKRNLVMKKKGYGDFLKYNDYTNINKWMKENTKKYDLDLVKKYDILIIERKVHKSYEIVEDLKKTKKEVDDKSYNNKLKELFKHSGKELRSIINHKEFVKFIKKLFPKKKVLNISLEYTPIFDQYKLFNNAKLIFCQHGASLSNIIFMNKDSQLVEIINKSKYELDNWFLPLSNVCKIKHHQYVTDEAHVNIDLDDFKKYLEKEKIL